jgi:selenocysteine-specific elongation factor
VEHLELVDALEIRDGLAVITKADVAGLSRANEVADQVARLLAPTSLCGSTVMIVSAVDGSGLEGLRGALLELRDRVLARADRSAEASRLAIDRAFTMKGRGAVVTGTLRGRPLAHGASLRLVPGARAVRARELQVHGRTVDSAEPGRVAINVAGVDAGELHRGRVLTDDPVVEASDRLLVRLARRLPDRTRARVHLGTAAVDGALSRSGRDAIDLRDGSVAAILRLAAPIAVAPGDRFVLRRWSGRDRVVGGRVLDAAPTRGISRRRQTAERVAALAAAVDRGEATGIDAARLELHGAVPSATGGVALARDVAERLEHDLLATFTLDVPQALPTARTVAARLLRRLVAASPAVAARAAVDTIDRLGDQGRLVRDGAATLLPGSRSGTALDATTTTAMDRLERILAVPAPPSLAGAARASGCPPAGVRALERAARIVLLEPDLAYAATAYRELAERALALAAAGPLTPASFRDATGTSRRYVMAILEDLDRRGVLRRTDAGHLPGPRAATVADIGR